MASVYQGLNSRWWERLSVWVCEAIKVSLRGFINLFIHFGKRRFKKTFKVSRVKRTKMLKSLQALVTCDQSRKWHCGVSHLVCCLVTKQETNSSAVQWRRCVQHQIDFRTGRRPLITDCGLMVCRLLALVFWGEAKWCHLVVKWFISWSFSSVNWTTLVSMTHTCIVAQHF